MTLNDFTSSFVDALAPEAVTALLDELTREDTAAFIYRGMQTLIGPSLDWNWHVDAMTEFLVRFEARHFRYGMVNVPPRSGKTKIFSSLLPALLLGINPKAKIIYISANQKLVEDSARDMLKVMDSPWYKRAFPRTRITKRALGEIRTSAGGYRFSTSIGGTLTGRGGDYIIIDDPLNADDAESETIRNSTNRFMESTVYSRLDNKRFGQMLIISQRLHEDDVCGRALASGKWEVLSIPAIAQVDTTYDLALEGRYLFRAGETMQPNREPLDVLMAEQVRMGSRRFAAQYIQQPAPANGSLFKRDWLRFEDEFTPMPGDQLIQSWDAANKDGDKTDYSVCVTAVVRKNTVYVIDIYRARLDFPDLLREVIRLALKHRPRQLLIEDAAAGTQLLQILRDEQPRYVTTPLAMKPQGSKIERAMIGATRVERGELVLPSRAPWLDIFVAELMAFPFARHDDQVDALSHLLTYTSSERPRGRALPWFGQQPGGAGSAD